MISYDININVGKLLHYSETLKPQIKTETLIMLINSFSKYVRQIYLSLIQDSIYSSRYKGVWEPVNEEGYLKYLGTTPVNDIFSVIEDALEIREIGHNIVIRIDPRYKYPGSRLPLDRVLRAIEHGTSDFNARPILVSVSRGLERNILRLWRSYLRLEGVN